jgi:peptide/nickel transport system substrate-binding protein
MTGIRVIDDRTIAFDHVVASPQHIFNFSFGILCREYYAFETWDDFMALIDRPFGSGQFVLVDHVFQQWIEFARNDNHWNTDISINLAGIVMREVPTESIVPALIAGEIHVGEPLVTVDNHEALQAAAHINETLFVANNLRHVTFNTLSPQLSDHRVRQALAYAFDTRAYIVADTGSPDLRSVGNSPFSPVSWAFPGEDALNNYEFDMERAHALMDEAGWLMADNGFRYKDGQRFSLLWLIYHEAAWPGIITGMAAHTWGELGAELDIQMMDFTTVSAMTTGMPPGEKDFDVFQMGWSMSVDPDLRGGLWDGSDSQNVAGTFFNSGFRDPRLMELIELGAFTMDQAERTAIYHEIAAITNYYLPVWVLSNGMNLWGFADDVKRPSDTPPAA